MLGTAFDGNAVTAIAEALNRLLADSFALYLKTKSFHWHMSGRHFREYHLMLDEQAAQILATTDPLAERVRKLGATTLHSIGEIGRLQSIADNDAEQVPALAMLAELLDDNRALAAAMRLAHEVCAVRGDVATRPDGSTIASAKGRALVSDRFEKGWTCSDSKATTFSTMLRREFSMAASWVCTRAMLCSDWHPRRTRRRPAQALPPLGGGGGSADARFGRRPWRHSGA